MSRVFYFLVVMVVSTSFAQDKIRPLDKDELSSEFAKNHHPEPEFYRRLLLNVTRKGEFLYRAPGAEPVKIQYQFDWDFSHARMKKDPEIPNYKTIKWVDWAFVGPSSYITVGTDPKKYPMNCVYVRGHDNLSQPLQAEVTRLILEVFLVTGDKACQGPSITDSRLYAPRPTRWSTYLSFELRDLLQMTPEYPKLQFFDNPFQLTHSGVVQ